MHAEPATSEFRVEKERVDALLTLSNGDASPGHFFVAKASAHTTGPERVGELLNAEPGFFPFETLDGPRTRTVLYNRRQVIMVALTENEARRDPGYDVATERFVSVLLSNGTRVAGSIRVYRPEGRDRLSDWARHADTFRYVEMGETTLLINITHVVEVSEVLKP
jgi:hypothetical protein